MFGGAKIGADFPREFVSGFEGARPVPACGGRAESPERRYERNGCYGQQRKYGGDRVEEEGIMPTRTQNPYYVMIGFFILGVIVFFILLAFWI